MYTVTLRHCLDFLYFASTLIRTYCVMRFILCFQILRCVVLRFVFKCSAACAVEIPQISNAAPFPAPPFVSPNDAIYDSSMALRVVACRSWNSVADAPSLTARKPGNFTQLSRIWARFYFLHFIWSVRLSVTILEL